MNLKETEPQILTRKEAKKRIEAMNLIDGFLFDSTLEIEEDAKVVLGGILKSIFNRDFIVKNISSQKVYQAIDTCYHGIRFDAYITESQDGNNPEATIYDVEMENREADKKYLPKRFRYYGALHDTKKLESGDDYDKLPDFVSVTILSYDPFSAGDMYYEANTVLTTHPDLKYNDGIKHIFLYCSGNPNFEKPDSPVKISPEHSKKLKEMLKYIVSGQKPVEPNTDIDAIAGVVAKVKNREEVTTAYMKQWDRELSIKRETEEKTKAEKALKTILYGNKNGVSDENIRSLLKDVYDYNDEKITELFVKANDMKKEGVESSKA